MHFIDFIQNFRNMHAFCMPKYPYHAFCMYATMHCMYAMHSMQEPCSKDRSNTVPRPFQDGSKTVQIKIEVLSLLLASSIE